MKFRVFFVVRCLTGLAMATPTDYCKLPCKGITSKNSGCDCLKGKNCSSEFKLLALSENERAFMLGNHNKYRRKVARGNEALLWHIEVANMMAFQYDEQLEYVAMCWAMKCESGEDACRRTETFDRIGQNSYTGTGSCDGFQRLHDAAKNWYVSCVAKGDCFMNTEFNQFIWAKTTHIGCARVQLTIGRCRILCNYGPREIFKPKAVFQVGPVGSECPNFTKHVNGLCEVSGEAMRSDSATYVDATTTHLVLVLSLFFLLT